MARPLIEFVFAQHLPWTPGLPGGARDDVSAKILSADAATGAITALVRYPAGWRREVPERLAAEEEFYVLDGALIIDGQVYARDTYACLPAGYARGAARSDAGCVTISFFDATPAPARASMAADADVVKFLDVMAMRWDASVADPTLAWMGNRRKVLKWDRQYDQKQTFLLSVPPHIYPENWACPTLTHPCVEESFQLAGDTVGPHGRMTAGAYFWRPAGVPHGPFGSRDGGLSLIRFKHGKHINIWDTTPVPYRYDFPYTPVLPPDMAKFGAVYEGPLRY
ncbi:MAG: DUF4437 domain-containing protein [Rhodospirillaceae bacterium]|nr:DUF4437 domain-containing protein [Rhodospirillaceae bacterium]